jgi:hypothetical protein
MDWFGGHGLRPRSWSPPVVGAFFQAALRYSSLQTSTPASNSNGVGCNDPPSPMTVRRSLLPSLQVSQSPPNTPPRMVPTGTQVVPPLDLHHQNGYHHVVNGASSNGNGMSCEDTKRSNGHSNGVSFGTPSKAVASSSNGPDSQRRIDALSHRLTQLSIVNGTKSSSSTSPSIVRVHHDTASRATPISAPSTTSTAIASLDPLIARASSTLQRVAAEDAAWQQRQNELSRRLDALITAAGGTPTPTPALAPASR